MNKLIASFSVFSCLMSATSMAQQNAEEGFSGEVSLNSGYLSQSSNLNTDDKHPLTHLNAEASSKSEFMLVPLGQINYTFGRQLDKQVYLGTSREDIAVGDFAFEIGYKQAFTSGMVVDISVLPTVVSGETWRDPYLLNASREVTDVSGNAYRLKLESIAGSQFTLDMAYATIDVNDELSGSQLSLEEQSRLKRDGNLILLKAEYQHRLSPTSAIIPSLMYKTRSADGKAMAYRGFGSDLTYFKVNDRHQYALTLGYETRGYDDIHPVFNKKRTDSDISLFVAYEYDEWLNWQDVSFISFLGYGTSSSDIDFYNESEYLISVGVNYQF